MAARIAQQETRVLNALGISQSLVKNSETQESLTEIINALSILTGSSCHPLLIKQAILELRGSGSRLVRMAEGELNADDSDARLRSTVIAEAKSSIQVISMISPQWWTSQVGKEYFALNREACQRGVRITRIFVGKEIDDAMNSLMTRIRNETGGTEILFAPEAQVPKWLCTPMVIADETVVWTTVLDDERKEEQEHHFSTRKVDVDAAKERFEKLREHALPFEEVRAEQQATLSAMQPYSKPQSGPQ